MDEKEFALLKGIIDKQNKRPASFWEGLSKEQKELGVVQDFCESVSWEVECKSSDQDPPDCIGRDERGEFIGFKKYNRNKIKYVASNY